MKLRRNIQQMIRSEFFVIFGKRIGSSNGFAQSFNKKLGFDSAFLSGAYRFIHQKCDKTFCREIDFLIGNIFFIITNFRKKSIQRFGKTAVHPFIHLGNGEIMKIFDAFHAERACIFGEEFQTNVVDKSENSAYREEFIEG